MAKNETRQDGTKWCAQCKAWVSVEDFAQPPKGYRVTICTPCGRENMATWARSDMVGRLPDEFSDPE